MRKSAFTLIELMVAVAILMVLFGVSMISFRDIIKQNDLEILKREIEDIVRTKQTDVLNGKFRNVVLYFDIDKEAYIITENRLDDDIRDENVVKDTQIYNLHITNYQKTDDLWTVEFSANNSSGLEVLYRRDENGNVVEASRGTCSSSVLVDCLSADDKDVRLYTYFTKDANGVFSNKTHLVFLNSKKTSTLEKITGVDVGNVPDESYKSAKVVIREPLAKPERNVSVDRFFLQEGNDTYIPVKKLGLLFSLPGGEGVPEKKREVWIK